MGLNKTMLIGRLGRDPETKHTPSGQEVTSFSIATPDKYTDKAGVKHEKTQWHDVIAWGKLSELCGKYLKKGSQCYVEGRLEYREWEKDGVKRKKAEIVLEKIEFLSSGSRQDGSGQADQSDASNQQSQSDDDSLPF